MRTRLYITAFLLLGAFIFLFGLGDMALTDPDESFYAETAREMLAEGEWGTPLIFGEPQFEKPALFYWLVKSSFMVFGVNEFAARFPSVILALLGLLGIFLLGRIFFSEKCGFLAAVIAATSMKYVVLARACVTDMALMVFILFVFVFFFLGWRKEKKLYFILASASMGLAVLTKGPIGLLIPGLVLLIYLSVSRQWGSFGKIPVISCVLAFLAAALPWYLYAYITHGERFLSEFFGFQNVTRFLVPEHRIGDSPFFYIPIVLAGFFPWTVFLPVSLWDHLRSKGKKDALVPGVKGFLLTWFLVVFVFFSISRTKLVTYIFPLFPVLPLIMARTWERILSGEGAISRRDSWIGASMGFFTFSVAAGFAVGYYICLDRYGVSLHPMIPWVAFLVFLGCVSVFFSIKRQQAKAFSVIVLLVALTIVPVTFHAFSVIDAFESSKYLSLRYKDLSREGEEVGGECDHRRGIAFYARTTEVQDIHPYHALKEFTAREDRVWCILQEKHYAQLDREQPGRMSDPIASSGEYVLVTNRGDDAGKYQVIRIE
ncbi:MAG: phospholipid carrier-dependent glycosyltransferase [Candidatus Omnitrophica bacterium]|nr:phospholipid carrier-dependent glycosyltransferase [Candidatus Omnitrophota bacterium]